MSKKPSPDLILALDIGSGCVKTLLARRAKRPEIIGVGRAEHTPGAFANGAIAKLPAVVQACDASVAAAEQMAGDEITASQTIIAISGTSPAHPNTLRLAEKISSELSLELIATTTVSFAIAQALTGTDPYLSALAIDIGASTTSISLIQGSDTADAQPLAIGANAITRRNFSALPTWLSGIELTIDSFGTTTLPPKILLYGGGASLIEIQGALATTDWHKHLPFPRRPIIDLLEPAEIPAVANRTNFPLDPTYTPAAALLHLSLTTPTTLRTKFAALLSH